MILGSFLGYVTGAYATDRLGRRATYVLFAVGALAMALICMMIPISNTSMLFPGISHGNPDAGHVLGNRRDAFPNRIRAACAPPATAFSYNAGRVIGSLFPLAWDGSAAARCPWASRSPWWRASAMPWSSFPPSCCRRPMGWTCRASTRTAAGRSSSLDGPPELASNRPA